MPFLVLCVTCAFTPNADTGEGTVTCDLVQQRFFGTRAEAEAYTREIWLAPTTWGHERRSPQDVIQVVEVAAEDDTSVGAALRLLREDPKLRAELANVYRFGINGKHPYHVRLAEARAYPDSVAVLEGDDGGQVYVVCPVRLIQCAEATLQHLLADIDTIEWPGQPDMAHIRFARYPAGVGVWGGMGGGQVNEGVWVHDRLREQGLEPAIRAVLAGERPAIH